MRRTNTPTLQDIGKEVGVSAMTVSLVLHATSSSSRVSEATRKKILEVAARMRYRPNAVARGLNRRRMNNIGFVAVIDGGEMNLYFLEVLNGILEASAQNGQNTTVFSISNWRDAEDRLLEFCDGRVDGMILLAPQDVSQHCFESLMRCTQIVTIHHSGSNFPPNLDVDDELGAWKIVNYLISQGHSRIAHFSGGEHIFGARKRMAGYCRALREAGIKEDLIADLITHGKYSVFSGRTSMNRLLTMSTDSSLPTAIFCASDAIAYGCMEVLATHGIRVPNDISIVGFDDTLMARMTSPPLTTLRQPFRRMGQRAVERLMQQIEAGAEDIAQAVDTIPSSTKAREETTQQHTHRTAPSAESMSTEPILTETGDVPTSYLELFDLELIIRNSVGPPQKVSV